MSDIFRTICDRISDQLRQSIDFLEFKAEEDVDSLYILYHGINIVDMEIDEYDGDDEWVLYLTSCGDANIDSVLTFPISVSDMDVSKIIDHIKSMNIFKLVGCLDKEMKIRQKKIEEMLVTFQSINAALPDHMKIENGDGETLPTKLRDVLVAHFESVPDSDGYLEAKEHFEGEAAGNC